MDAVDFIKTKNRMCNYYTLCSDGCSLLEYCTTTGSSCDEYENEPERVVTIVEMWGKEHPLKTIIQDFLEKYPKAILDTSNKTPLNICPTDLGYTDRKLCAGGICDSKLCEECWNHPLEE